MYSVLQIGKTLSDSLVGVLEISSKLTTTSLSSFLPYSIYLCFFFLSFLALALFFTLSLFVSFFLSSRSLSLSFSPPSFPSVVDGQWKMCIFSSLLRFKVSRALATSLSHTLTHTHTHTHTLSLPLIF